MGRLIWVMVGALLVTACGAAASFPYRYYVLKADRFEGTLVGDKPQNDLPLSVCAPETGKQGKCLVMLKDAYLKLKSDYLDLQTKLKDCQKGR